MQVGQKNDDISKSENPIDTGAIFPDRLAPDLSRNVFVCTGMDFRLPNVGKKIPIISTLFHGSLRFWLFSWSVVVVQKIIVPIAHACTDAGYMERDGEGSTSPSRGKHG